MTTNRPYAAALDAFDAAQQMQNRLDDHFDQQLLKSFIVLLGKAG